MFCRHATSFKILIFKFRILEILNFHPCDYCAHLWVVLSSFRPVLCDVPQGSILRPLLFLLFINDLPLYTSNICTDLYADDTTLYDVQSSLIDIEIIFLVSIKQTTHLVKTQTRP